MVRCAAVLPELSGEKADRLGESVSRSAPRKQGNIYADGMDLYTRTNVKYVTRGEYVMNRVRMRRIRFDWPDMTASVLIVDSCRGD